MVEEHLGAEIDLRHVGHRSPRTAADRQEVAPGQQQEEQRRGQSAPRAARLPVEEPQHPAVEPHHRRRIYASQQGLPHAQRPIDARHRLLRIGQIDQNRGIEPEPPMLVQGDIHGENDGRQKRDEDEIARHHPPPKAFGEAHPARQQGQKQRQRRHIPRHRRIERQSVPDHGAPAAETRAGRLRGVPRQKDGLLHRHRKKGRAENGKNERNFSFHLQFFPRLSFLIRRPDAGIRAFRRRPGRPRPRFRARCRNAT